MSENRDEPLKKAAFNNHNFALVPVNEDGSINVKVTDEVDVNIEEVGGYSIFGKVPVEVK